MKNFLKNFKELTKFVTHIREKFYLYVLKILETTESLFLKQERRNYS